MTTIALYLDRDADLRQRLHEAIVLLEEEKGVHLIRRTRERTSPDRSCATPMRGGGWTIRTPTQ